MFGSEALEVAIGLALVFFVLAAASSAVVELLASGFKKRSSDLNKALRRLVAGTADTPAAKPSRKWYGPRKKRTSEEALVAVNAIGFVNDLYDASPIRPLVAAAKGKPSYIPAKNFAEGVVAIVREGMNAAATPPGTDYQVRLEANYAALEQSLNALPSNLRRQLLNAAGAVGANVVAIQAELEDWFDSSMDRASGVFKRWSRLVVVVFAAVIVVLFNVDSTKIAVELWEAQESRASVVAAAEAIVANEAAKGTPLTAQKAVERVGNLPVPIGWDPFCEERNPDDCTFGDTASGFWRELKGNWNSHVLGWIITILMVSLGAPFWYDALSKLVSIRGAGAKPGKAADEEGSATKLSSDERKRAPSTSLSDPLRSLAVALTPSVVGAAAPPQQQPLAPPQPGDRTADQ